MAFSKFNSKYNIKPQFQSEFTYFFEYPTIYKNYIKNVIDFYKSSNIWQINKHKFPQNFKINVNIVKKNTILKLNQQFKNKNNPTDVLTFYYNENDLLGEIYLCISEIKKNAKEFNNNDIKNEILLMIVHSLIHMCGYDHGNIMKKLQDEWVQRFEENI